MTSFFAVLFASRGARLLVASPFHNTIKVVYGSTTSSTMSEKIRSFRTKGLLAAPCTFFKENGDVDLDIIPRYIQHMIDFGVRNAFVTGSNGEGHKMTVQERKQFMDAWITASKGKLDANIFHIGTGNLRESQELAKYAEEIGADAIACVGPTYFKPQKVEDYVEYMRLVAAAAPTLPFYLYDIDFLTGIKIPASEFMSAAKDKIPTMAGLKHTSPDFISMSNILLEHGDRFQLLMGTEEMYLQGLAIGIEDTIVGTFMGHILNRLKAAFDKGDLAAARKEQERAIKIGNIRRGTGLSIPASHKATLQAIGFPAGQPRPPCTPISQDVVAKIKKDLQEMGFFEWGPTQ